ncbi:MAG: glutamate racemase [Chlamydiota bacterium]
MRTKSIGIFDSGIGGLSVFRQVVELLPNESVIYFGDTARVPYGNRDPETIIQYAMECADFLVSQDVKMLVVACNTICAYAFEALQNRFSLPIVGVIDSGLKTLLQTTKNEKVGILGTTATISSGIYPRKIGACNPQIQVHSVATPLFVPLVEEGFIEHKAVDLIVEEYLSALKKENIDSILLACTHYPFLRKVIEKCVGNKIVVKDASEACAIEVSHELVKRGLATTATEAHYLFFVSGEAKKFQKMGEKFLGRNIESIQEVTLP